MRALVRLFVVARRFARPVAGYLFGGGWIALLVAGLFAPGGAAIEVQLGAAVAWACLLVTRLGSRFRAGGAAPAGDLELGVLLLGGAYAVVDRAGGLGSPLYPVVLVVVAALAVFSSALAALGLVLLALALETAMVFLLPGGSRSATALLAAHAPLIAAFALLNYLFTRTEVLRARTTSRRRLDAEMSRVREEARDFRLIAAPLRDGAGTLPPAERESRLFHGAVREIHESLYFTLDLLKKSLGLKTCILLWLDATGQFLKIRELVTDTDDVVDRPIPTTEGAIAGALRGGVVVNLAGPRLGHGGAAYYRSGTRVQALLMAPVADSGAVRGLLCADRAQSEPFGEVEEDIVRSAVQSILRAVQNERVFVQLERSKAEQGMLYRASQSLASALTEEQVLEAALKSARDIADYDFAAITLYDTAAKKHTIRRAVGEGSTRLEGVSFGDNAGLCAMAVKNRHYLPYRGEWDPSQQIVYTRKAKIPRTESLLILPLVVHDEAIGSLALATARSRAFGEGLRSTLHVLASQLAVSLQNARMYRRLEELATTDGLTGLYNHRVFQEEIGRKLKSAERFSRRLSLILTDLDHFKSVNDRHGHPMGDQVLRGMARVLDACKRDTDLVARYGGEEFAVICEQTDAVGARSLAERIRSELARLVFTTDQGKLQVTCSLGIATFPDDGREKAEVVERADQALYAAKHGGRNRAVAYRELLGAPLPSRVAAG